jgi:hypothetical protein
VLQLRVILIACVLGACNQVFDLDSTFALDAFVPFDDRDRDGIADDRDNCVDLANADQLDGDVDGRGDACDGCDACSACDHGVDHDEDGDKVPDGCDRCPEVADPAQPDQDDDGVGDACDATALVNQRQMFDGFATLEPEWLQGGAPWGVVDDQITPQPGIEGGPYQLRHTQPIQAGWDWFVELAVRVPDVNGFLCGLSLFGATSSTCWILQDAPGVVINLSGSNGARFTPRGPVIRLRLHVSGPPGQQTIECSALDDAQTVLLTGTFDVRYPIAVSLISNTQTRFPYIDVVGSGR